MTDMQKLKYDIAMQCALVKAISKKNFTGDTELLNFMLEEFKEFYRGCNTENFDEKENPHGVSQAMFDEFFIDLQDEK